MMDLNYDFGIKFSINFFLVVSRRISKYVPIVSSDLCAIDLLMDSYRVSILLSSIFVCNLMASYSGTNSGTKNKNRL